MLIGVCKPPLVLSGTDEPFAEIVPDTPPKLSYKCHIFKTLAPWSMALIPRSLPHLVLSAGSDQSSQVRPQQSKRSIHSFDSEELANFINLCAVGIINTQAAPQLIERVEQVSLRFDPKSKYRNSEYSKRRRQAAAEVANRGGNADSGGNPTSLPVCHRVPMDDL
jgi:hypothetical protein